MNTVQPPPTYYTVNNPADPVARAMTKITKLKHLLFEQAMPGEDTDFELTVATLAIATGYSRRRVSNIILAFSQLSDLPLLNTLQHELFHLDQQRLISISQALFGLNPEHLPIVDELLTDYLTPTAPNEALPLAGAISRKIKAIRDMLKDPKASGDDTGPGKKEFATSDNPDGTTDLYATVDPVEGKLINDAVSKHAEATGKTPGEAFVDLILSKIKIGVQLNIYRASDLAHAPAWVSGIGWLDEATGNHWAARATRTQDMDKAFGKHVAGHDPTPDIRAAVEGRDGGCTAPYCPVPATHCDLDHRINHADGGCTCTANLCCLCRRHHNGKTCGRTVYLQDPVTGIVVSVLENGKWAVTVPEGPLTPQSARWAQTVSQYRTAHHRRWAAAAEHEQSARTAQVQEDEPPF